MTRQALRVGLVVWAAVFVASCAGNRPPSTTAAPGAPRFAGYPTPDIPLTLAVSPDVRTRHAEGWQRLQAGDLRGAARDFNAILKQVPGLYPAETALGFVHLANRQYKNAQPRFAAAIGANDRYLPAWIGQAEALLGLERDADAIAAMERVIALDPQQESVRTRLELVRFRLSQSLIESGQRARAAGRHDEAVQQFEQALAMSPQSTMILSELTETQTAAGRLDQAERHARRAIEVEPREARWQVALGDVLEARGQLRDAAAAYTRADRLESNPEWRAKSRALRERAEMAALPPEFSRVASAATITRAEVAAFIGIHLRELVDAAPARVNSVVTDVRTHWASPWILPVTRAGIMTVFPNYTFQPGATVRRGDLASVVAALVRLAGASRRAELAKWQAARPRFADLPPANVFYTPAALAVTANAMTLDATGRFNPTRPATGADLEAAVRRIAQLTTP